MTSNKGSVALIYVTESEKYAVRPSYVLDGSDPIAVQAAIERAKKELPEGFHVICVNYSLQSPDDLWQSTHMLAARDLVQELNLDKSKVTYISDLLREYYG